MTSCRISVVIALLGLTCTATTQVAARERSNSGRNIPSITVLSLENVQAELRLSAEQKAKLAQMRRKLQEGMRSAIPGEDVTKRDPGQETEETSEEQPQDPAARMLAQMEKLDNEVKMVIDSVLSESQRKRLQEINLQARGPSALADPEVMRQLQLTQEQRQQLAKIQSAISRQRMKVFQEVEITATQERGRRLDLLRQEERRLKLAVLTNQQRAMFQRMMGAKIELDMSRATRLMNNS